MSWEVALRGRLLDNADVLALVGRHPDDQAPSIDWTLRREGAPIPALVLQTISDSRPQTHDGFDAVWSSRVQLAVLAADRGGVIALRGAAIAALADGGEFAAVSGGSTTWVWFECARVDLIRDDGGKTTPSFVHRDTVDLVLWHN